MENDLIILRNGIKKDRNQQLILGFLFLLLAVFIFFRWSVQLPTEMPPTTLFLRIIALLFLFFSLYLFYTASKAFKISNTKLIKLLENEKEEIVWVYSYRVVPMPFGIKFSDVVTVFFYFLDGTSYDVRVENASYNELMKKLNERLPHATFGHSKQKEQLYKANPAMLLRSQDDKSEEN